MKQTGAVLVSETAALVKKGASSAVETARSIGTHLTNLNGDAQVYAEDLKVAAKKPGVVGVAVISFVGRAIVVRTFVASTASFGPVAVCARL